MPYCENSQAHTTFPAGANSDCVTCTKALCDACKSTHRSAGHTLVPIRTR